MTHEVVVVGGGIGGLTVAALLAARGVDVCLIEREWHTGGCAAPFEIMDYRFEAGAGFYPQWGPGQIHERVFAELGVPPPAAVVRTPSYVVRLPDGNDFRVESDDEIFFSSLRRHFPECAAEAVNFYHAVKPPAEALQRLGPQTRHPSTLSPLNWLGMLAAEPRLTSQLWWRARRETVHDHLTRTSRSFRRFIDAQLMSLVAQTSEHCSWLAAAFALHFSRLDLYALRDGAVGLISALNEAVKRAGGTVRLGATALRLVHDDQKNRAAGVVLLSGETIGASRAVVSNLTVRDTYDKLIGVNRTPPALRTRLKRLGHSGRYLLFLALDDKATSMLPAEQMIILTDERETALTDALFNLNVARAAHQPVDSNRTAVTLTTYSEVEQWFSFQIDEGANEALDRATLERWWPHIAASVPELGNDVELIGTATPRDFYERTRRRLGAVGGEAGQLFSTGEFGHRSFIPNLYLVGDTVFPGYGLAAVSHSAMIVADEIAPPLKR